ncbi:MAG: hypothetical protein K6E51_05600 [Treponema sp.]|nr:hypothetical protein [Treponema sp.]
MSNKPRNEKRIEKVRGKPLSSFNWFKAYPILLTRPETVKSAYSFLYTVTKSYLGIQFFQKWGLFHLPVVNVQTDLDDRIPFTPHRVGIYMHFVNFWLQPLVMLITRYGIHNAAPICNRYLDAIKKIYQEASKIYMFSLSTTNRPDYRETKEFRTIHRFDPHLLCVPSLHIAIIVLCYTFFRDVFSDADFTEEERKQWNAELYKGTVEIAESVLYVKQHSVHCVPAAMYMMTRTFPELFSSQDAVQLINDMFSRVDDMTPEDRKEIREYIHYMYERLYLEGLQEEDWTVPVKHWIVDYAKQTGQQVPEYT